MTSALPSFQSVNLRKTPPSSTGLGQEQWNFFSHIPQVMISAFHVHFQILFQTQQ